MPLEGTTLVEAVDPTAPEALSLAAGLCGRIAHDLGARVVRIVGADAHAADAATDAFLHAGKPTLRPPAGQRDALVADLSAAADAVLTDAESFDRHPASARATPIVLALDGRGTTLGSEFTVEAASGLLDLVGDPDRQPLRLGGHQTAYSGGLAAFLAFATSLVRPRTPATAPMRVDLLEVAVWLNWKTLGVALQDRPVPHRAGPAGEWFVAPCADGHVAIVHRELEWETLKAVTGDPRLSDPRFGSIPDRRRNRPALNGILSEIFAPMTRAEIARLSIANKLPFGPVYGPADLADDPHLRERGTLVEEAMDGRTVRFPRVPVGWNGRPLPRRRVEPAT